MAGRERSRGSRISKQDTGWEGWGGYMEAKRRKLKDQFLEGRTSEGERSHTVDIFKDITVYVNGYTKPSSDEIKKLILLYGGYYEHYLSKTRVTHIIASNLPNSKISSLRGMKVIKPDWIVDSVKAKKLLPCVQYQLYIPETIGMHRFATTVTAATTMTTTTPASITSEVPHYNTHSTSQDELNSECPSLDDSKNFLDDDVFENNSDELFDDDIDEKTENRDSIDLHLIGGLRVLPVDQNLQDVRLDSSSVLLDDDSESGQIQTDNPDISSVNITHDPVSKSDISRGAGSSHDLSLSDISNKFTVQAPVHTASSAGYVSEYYSHSRLHHLSTWKLELAAYVKELQVNSDNNFPGRERLCRLHMLKSDSNSEIISAGCHGKPCRVIMHVDMDCFFVSVGLRHRPELRGKPVAVTHSRGKGLTNPLPGSDPVFERDQWAQKRLRITKVKQNTQSALDEVDFDENLDFDEEKLIGEPAKQTFHSMASIACCSYEARKAGLKNGMLMGEAKALCPDLVTIPYDFDQYNNVSRLLYQTVASYTHDIEAGSCDEMLVDCTDILSTTGVTPLEFASIIRDEIYQATGCPASAGIGANILMARMATKQGKPNGQCQVTAEEAIDFIKPQPVRDLPGVGWSLAKKLESMNVAVCGDLQAKSLQVLQKAFGPKTGKSLYDHCRGLDSRPIKMENERKSVSAEINYGIRFQKVEEAGKFFCELAGEVHSRLSKIGMRGKHITLKLMIKRDDAPTETAKFMGHGICNNLSRSSSLPIATDDSRLIGQECMNMLKATKVKVQDLRGIGIQVQKLESVNPEQTRTRCASRGLQSIRNFAVPQRQLKSVTENTVNTLVRDDEVLPPLPSLVITDLNSIGVRKPSASNEGILPEKTPIKDLITTEGKRLEPIPDESYLVSPSQIDPEVLKELPADIRKQIEDQLKASKKHKTVIDHRPTTRRLTSSQQRPSCSHWTEKQPISRLRSANDDEHVDDVISLDDPESTANQRVSDNALILRLPSPSQIDKSCLDALPIELQREIQAAYAEQEKQAQKITYIQPSPSVIPPSLSISPSKFPYQLKQAAVIASPSKLCSPAKRASPQQQGKSPVFKVPGTHQGRKRRIMAKKLVFTRQPKINIAVNGITKELPPLVDEPVCSKSVNQSADITKRNMMPNTNIAMNTTATFDNITSVNLCGAITLTEVKAIIREWLDTSPAAEDEDICIMIDYLQELIHDKNLEMVDLVIKFLYRLIHRHAGETWRNAYISITDYTKAVIFSIYGSQLRVQPITV